MTTMAGEHNIPPLHWPDIEKPISYRWVSRSQYVGLAGIALGLILSILYSLYFLLSVLFVPIGIWIGLVVEKRVLRPQLSALEQQLSSRDEIPQDIWGGDAEKAAMFERFLDDAYISWQSRNFIPEDPLFLVVYTHTYLDSEEIEMRELVKKLIDKELTWEEVRDLLKGTLGEAIDFFLANDEEVAIASTGHRPEGDPGLCRKENQMKKVILLVVAIALVAIGYLVGHMHGHTDGYKSGFDSGLYSSWGTSARTEGLLIIHLLGACDKDDYSQVKRFLNRNLDSAILTLTNIDTISPNMQMPDEYREVIEPALQVFEDAGMSTSPEAACKLIADFRAAHPSESDNQDVLRTISGFVNKYSKSTTTQPANK
ncbi:MAG: hypothetical protein HN350_08025 [Phycisphaerales bacterium]|jgi:hypothetical protein|nr:hypothetical protein [Phycisphaerales bacterium]